MVQLEREPNYVTADWVLLRANRLYRENIPFGFTYQHLWLVLGNAYFADRLVELDAELLAKLQGAFEMDSGRLPFPC